MKSKRRLQLTTEIDVGAFSDIAFLLIIFFILTTSIIRISGQQLDLPTGEQSKEKQKENTLTIYINGARIHYGEADNAPVVSLLELRTRLLEADLKNKLDSKERMVILDSTKDVVYDLYFQVVSTISNAGGILALVEEDVKGSGEEKGQHDSAS